MNCPKLALRTIQSDGGGRLRSRQLREGVKIPAPPLYNDVGHAFHSDFFYSLTHCFQAKKKKCLCRPTDEWIRYQWVNKHRYWTLTFSYDARRCFPGSSPASSSTSIIALINTPLLSLRCLAWAYTPPFL